MCTMTGMCFIVFRPMKFVGAAHFTLRCGRQLADGSAGAPVYQLPLVALVCNFGSAALVSELSHPIDGLVRGLRGWGESSIAALGRLLRTDI